MKDLRGKTALITGGTSGIGREAAIGLARLGMHVLVTARDETKGHLAVSAMNEMSAPGRVELLIVDLSSLLAVRHFADMITGHHSALHALVNNAGVMEHEPKTSADGIELDTAVDYYAPVLLTELLLPLLQKSAPSEIVNVSSSMHHEGNLDFATFGKVEFFDHYQSYADAKLALILYTRLLARRLTGSGVRANAYHPGTIRTSMTEKNMKRMNPLSRFLFRRRLKSVEDGAAGIVALLADERLGGFAGEYVIGREIGVSSEKAKDDHMGEELYQRTRVILGLS